MVQGIRRSAAGGGSSEPVSRRLPNSGYAVSAVWLEPTVYPFLGYLRAKSRLAAVALRNTPAGVVPRTPFTRKGYAASVKRRSR